MLLLGIFGQLSIYIMNREIIPKGRFQLIIERFCYQLIEHHGNFEHTVLIGMQPRGIYLAKAVQQHLQKIKNGQEIPLGTLDVTFYRDDFRRRPEPMMPQFNEMEFLVEGKNVVLIDDVLYTGRTVRAALEALMDYGRPDKVDLLVLVDRIYSRHLPIEPDYVGIEVDTRVSQNVKVNWTAEGEAENVVLL